MNEDHVYRRQTPMVRWLPAVFYSVNLIIWMLTAIVTGAWDLLFLTILPMPALVVYVIRTQRNEQ
jgi:hypothetical protein